MVERSGKRNDRVLLQLGIVYDTHVPHRRRKEKLYYFLNAAPDAGVTLRKFIVRCIHTHTHTLIKYN